MTTSKSISRKEELLRRLRRLCPMSRRTHTLHEKEVRIWTACDLDPLLDALDKKPPDDPDVVDERMPYWAELWPCAIALSTCILDSKLAPPPGPWLELGCGPAMPGVAAALSGRRGVCTDYVPESLWLAELNAIEQGVESRIDFLELDWRSPPKDKTYSWILASDVAYEERNFQPLLNCFDTLLAPDGEIWFTEPGRSITKPFYDQLSESGWTRHLICQRDPIKIHRIRRAEAR